MFSLRNTLPLKVPRRTDTPGGGFPLDELAYRRVLREVYACVTPEEEL